MAKVIGQLDSLKSLRSRLNQNGIRDFNSVGDLNTFISTYDNAKQKILEEVEQQFEHEFEALKRMQNLISDGYRRASKAFKENDDAQLKSLDAKRDLLIKKYSANVWSKLIYGFQLILLNKQRLQLESSYDERLSLQMRSFKDKIAQVNGNILEYSHNKERIIELKSQPKLEELRLRKNVIKELNPLILGAIGENLVMKELKKLPNDHILINDFDLQFSKAIYYRQEDAYIRRIQIDHLLISPAGIFIIETKNWSQKSINTLSLRSPISQIRRSNYALFTVLNSQLAKDHIHLNHHHWGEKDIPMRNLVVMVNKKPAEEFRYVKVKTLKEVNGYINHFKPVFSPVEVNNIYTFLVGLQHHV